MSITEFRYVRTRISSVPDGETEFCCCEPDSAAFPHPHGPADGIQYRPVSPCGGQRTTFDVHPVRQWATACPVFSGAATMWRMADPAIHAPEITLDL
ncbi:MAG TPA: hypothetical protein VIU15_01985, partial [Streptomyces sp.]